MCNIMCTTNKYEFNQIKIVNLKFKNCKSNWVNDNNYKIYDEYKTFKNYYKKAYLDNFIKQLTKDFKSQFKNDIKSYDVKLNCKINMIGMDATTFIKFTCDDMNYNINNNLQTLKNEISIFINNYLSNMKNNEIDYLMIC